MESLYGINVYSFFQLISKYELDLECVLTDLRDQISKNLYFVFQLIKNLGTRSSMLVQRIKFSTVTIDAAFKTKIVNFEGQADSTELLS